MRESLILVSSQKSRDFKVKILSGDGEVYEGSSKVLDTTCYLERLSMLKSGYCCVGISWLEGCFDYRMDYYEYGFCNPV